MDQELLEKLRKDGQITDEAYNRLIASLKSPVSSQTANNSGTESALAIGPQSVALAERSIFAQNIRNAISGDNNTIYEAPNPFESGWFLYGNWSNTPEHLKNQYFIDEGLSLNNGRYTGLACIQILRQNLQKSGSSVRLVGLSGVGKTRLVQALFDPNVGERPLDQHQVIYTDVSDGAMPPPISMAHQLIAKDQTCIMVVDNCQPDLHGRLTKICLDSPLRLMTIEYDVRDDLPEKTEVFRLSLTNEKIAQKLVASHYPHVSKTDSKSISHFAGGNTRVALALANTLQQGENLSSLKEEDLFSRLFHQGHDKDTNLLRSAKVLSLVYSFNGEDMGDESELQFLASLIDRPVLEVYENISRLIERDLIQSRDVWRAVLPHAIANRLAEQALKSIPKKLVVELFSTSTYRLLQSFTRRITYLHQSPQAIDIARDWLSPEGLIGSVNGQFNSLGLEVLKNIAPLEPEATLTLLEGIIEFPSDQESWRADEYHKTMINLLRDFAYDTDLFGRSTSLLCEYAILENAMNNNHDSARAVLKRFFHVMYSETEAPPDARAGLLETLLQSPNRKKYELGTILLNETLQTDGFYEPTPRNFGAKSRGYGYHPSSREETTDWFKCFILSGMNSMKHREQLFDDFRRILANNLHMLWLKIGVKIDKTFLTFLEEISLQIHSQRAWNKGWLAIRSLMRHDINTFDAELASQLRQLENQVRPRNLLELTRTYALMDSRIAFEVDDDFGDNEDTMEHLSRVQKKAYDLGVDVAKDMGILQKLIGEIVSNPNKKPSQSFNFGKGLGNGSQNKPELWDQLFAQVIRTPEEKY